MAPGESSVCIWTSADSLPRPSSTLTPISAGGPLVSFLSIHLTPAGHLRKPRFTNIRSIFFKHLEASSIGIHRFPEVSSCIAVSRHAKILGVRSGATIRAAREVIPDMIFVLARHDVYVRLHKRILAVIDTVVPVSKVR